MESARSSGSAIVVLLVLPLLLWPVYTVEALVVLWPQPQAVSFTGGPPIALSAKFTINAPAEQTDILSAARRYTRLIRTERWLPISSGSSTTAGPNATREATAGTVLPQLASLQVTVVDFGADLQHGVDESYRIVVTSSPVVRAALTARTVWGAMRGLETFSQLVQRADGDRDGGARLIIDGGVVVEDHALYPHRGVLLDVARNFYPVKDLKRTIRALSYNKLNVLHLHITDSQSFPLELESEPALSRDGSYGPHFVYSKSDIEGLIAYARKFGVRVVPEIDTPGEFLIVKCRRISLFLLLVRCDDC